MLFTSFLAAHSKSPSSNPVHSPYGLVTTTTKEPKDQWVVEVTQLPLEPEIHQVTSVLRTHLNTLNHHAQNTLNSYIKGEQKVTKYVESVQAEPALPNIGYVALAAVGGQILAKQTTHAMTRVLAPVALVLLASGYFMPQTSVNVCTSVLDSVWDRDERLKTTAKLSKQVQSMSRAPEQWKNAAEQQLSTALQQVSDKVSK